MSSLSIAEICEKLKNAKTKVERTKILKDNDCLALRGILRMNFDDSLAIALPKGIPPYKELKVPPGFGNTTLKTSATGWYVFIKELSPNMSQTKRESVFISLLENLDPKEATILIQAKDKKLDLGLTKKAINETFPGLIKTEVTQHGSKEKPSKTTTTSAATSNGKGV